MGVEVVYKLEGDERSIWIWGSNIFCPYKFYLKNQRNVKVSKFILLLRVCVIYVIERSDEFLTTRESVGH